MISQDKKSLEILGFFRVFPACAGVSLLHPVGDISKDRFPRVCGGEPGAATPWMSPLAFSPRVRG